MRLRVLGCHGGESASHRCTCFQIDDSLILDAGALTRGLTVSEQAKINHVFVSHTHLDHCRDLAMLADNIIGQKPHPVEIYCTDYAADVLEKNFFNNHLWPDFTKIPNPADPSRGVLHINRIKTGEAVQVGDYSVKPILVHHSVECQAMFVTGKSGTIVYSGDTGPTDRLWTELNNLADLKALIVEVSFPNKMEKLANISGHLTPAMLAKELEKFRPRHEVPVLLYGMKPSFHEVLKSEIAELADPRLTMLKPMDEFVF